MIKAVIDRGGMPKLALLGLSEMNIQRLKEGKPIYFSGKEIGIDKDVGIVFGKTEMHIADEIESTLAIIAAQVGKNAKEEKN